MPAIHIQQVDASCTSLTIANIYCVGLNYSEHIHEMKSQRPDEPVIFLKPTSALRSQPETLNYPSHLTQDMHHEVEIVVALGSGGYQIPLDKATDLIAAYGIGLDLTLRDRQSKAKQQGKPWAVAKGFKDSAPVSAFVSADQIADPQNLSFELHINQSLRQQGHSSQMLFSIAEIIAYLSTVFELQAGDLIFTGTPAGVAALLPGDQIQANLENKIKLDFKVQ